MNNLSRYYPVLPLIILLGIVFVISFSEYWAIGSTQSPEILNNYNFGSEAMIYHGGEIYRSAASYSEYHLLLALISLSTIAAVVAIIEKCKSHQVFKSYLFAGALLVLWLLV
ncbi:hypothetical protein J8M20_13805 [Pseudoalteromonas luteoviolacea]|uniref:hypothetical protein n=1 Tax=Pseudoalteromonas luteoviolacea TaxID=43657 RepID=UPI001B370486|nr:hypothetical protein [Pseudoalteromonas luteoviolacea]MBQ4812427.1 hypothetical protein [Pseudoalteromonas luteoviolacea]